jgi:hypothetical protein
LELQALQLLVLDWESTCSDVGKDTFELSIDMINDACPNIPIEGFGKIKVVVSASSTYQKLIQFVWLIYRLTWFN